MPDSEVTESRRMSELIDEALREDNEWENPDQYPVASVLWQALNFTGPLFHRGSLFRFAEGEEFNRGIQVIEDVRLASEVEIPFRLPDWFGQNCRP
jgi:hypothetical protein